MEIIEKEVIKDSKKEYASKGVAGTALGLGIAGTALWLLNGGLGNGGGLFGNGGTGVGSPTYTQTEIDVLAAKECQDALELTKAIYDQRILTMNERFNDRQTINGEMFGLYKSQIDADFGLYKNQRDGFDVLSNRIAKLETAEAVNAAVEPWRAKVLQMQISGVAANAQAAINLEAERRCCADGKIVNYVNSTFYPIEVADLSVKNTATPKDVYNPLCNCCNSCGI